MFKYLSLKIILLLAVSHEFLLCDTKKTISEFNVSYFLTTGISSFTRYPINTLQISSSSTKENNTGLDISAGIQLSYRFKSILISLDSIFNHTGTLISKTNSLLYTKEKKTIVSRISYYLINKKNISLLTEINLPFSKETLSEFQKKYHILYKSLALNFNFNTKFGSISISRQQSYTAKFYSDHHKIIKIPIVPDINLWGIKLLKSLDQRLKIQIEYTLQTINIPTHKNEIHRESYAPLSELTRILPHTSLNTRILSFGILHKL